MANFTNKTQIAFSVCTSQAYWQSKRTRHTLFTPSFLHPTPASIIPSVAKDWARDQEVDLELSVCELASCEDSSQKNKWLYISVPAGNAIQAFGYGTDNMQNKDESVPGPSATVKAGLDGSTSTSEPSYIPNETQPGDEAQGKVMDLIQ